MCIINVFLLRIQRAHRTLMTINKKVKKTRDVICKVLCFSKKEAIICGYWSKLLMEHYTSFTICYAAVWRLVHPLLNVLKEGRIGVQVGLSFPFDSNKRWHFTASIWDKDDLQNLLQTLNLPAVGFLYCRYLRKTIHTAWEPEKMSRGSQETEKGS